MVPDERVVDVDCNRARSVHTNVGVVVRDRGALRHQSSFTECKGQVEWAEMNSTRGDSLDGCSIEEGSPHFREMGHVV